MIGIDVPGPIVTYSASHEESSLMVVIKITQSGEVRNMGRQSAYLDTLLLLLYGHPPLAEASGE